MRFNPKTVFLLFVVLVLIQWYVPAKMIVEKETVIQSGQEFKFRIRPIDPVDPFRGEYISLNFETNQWEATGTETFETNQTVYAEIGKDHSGFAVVTNVTSKKPQHTSDFVKAEIQNLTSPGIRITYPFNRFYMEEGTAWDAENIIREALQDSMRAAYALVNVKDGNAVITNILVDDATIEQLLQSGRKSGMDQMSDTVSLPPPLD